MQRKVNNLSTQLHSLLKQGAILLNRGLYVGQDSADSDAASDTASSVQEMDGFLTGVSTYIDCLADMSTALKDPVIGFYIIQQ